MKTTDLKCNGVYGIVTIVKCKFYETYFWLKEQSKKVTFK